MWAAAIPALIAAAGSIGGGLLSQGGASQQNATSWQIAQMQQQMQRETNAQQIAMYEDNRDWQTNMANTAYQRQMQDMRTAGLNPILAYQKGGGAPVPQATPPSLGTADIKFQPQNTQAELGRAVGNAASSAMSAANTMADIENKTQQNALLGEQTKKTQADTNLSNVNAVKAATDTDFTKEQIKNMPWLQALLKGQTSAAYAGASQSSATAAAVSQDAARKESTGDSWLGHQVNTLKRLWGSMPDQTSAKPVGGRGPDTSFPDLWKKVFGK